MKISVALCTYNGARFILEQLESIATQTRLPDEVIVCDDCSSDGTLEMVAQFATTAPFKLQYSSNPSRLGVTRNFGRAISLCTGDVVFLCDQDDVWLPQKVATMAVPFLANEKIGLVFSNAYITDSRLNRLGYTVWDTFRFDKKSQQIIKGDGALALLIRRNVITGATAAFRMTLRDKVLPIPDALIHDAWIAIVAAAASQIEPVDVPLILYRQHEKNVIGGRRQNFLEKIAQARQIEPESFDAEILQASELFRPEIYRQLQAMTASMAAPKILHEIQNKIKHLNARKAVFYCGLLSRIRIVIGELVALRYHRYSRGWESVFTDLMLRKRRSIQPHKAV